MTSYDFTVLFFFFPKLSLRMEGPVYTNKGQSLIEFSGDYIIDNPYGWAFLYRDFFPISIGWLVVIL